MKRETAPAGRINLPDSQQNQDEKYNAVTDEKQIGGDTKSDI